MQLSEFVGNKRVVKYFTKALQRGHLGHAYLFAGPQGVGKATLASMICKRLLCKNPKQEDACGTCPSCVKLASGNHPDFHLFEPEGLYFKIDQVRQIIHHAALKPVESSWKTFLLKDVHHMREEASNAFLKVLEEPPGQAIFFLIAERSEGLLPTIRSRCQFFDFQPLQQQEIKTWLIRNKEMSESEAETVSRYTHGSIGRALTLNAEQYREVRDKVLLALEATLLPKSYLTLMDSIKAITVERTEMQERLLILEELTRDLLLVKTSPIAKLIHDDARDRLLQLVTNVERHPLQQFYEDLLETREAILKINAHVGLSLQTLFLSLRIKVPDAKRKSA